MNIDMAELDGMQFDCVDGCGMCCLCQPELSDDDLRVFESDEFLAAGLTKEHIDGRRTSRPTAIKLQGRWGACYFLKNRRCTINEIKPRFCRQFPVHIHVMRRVQLTINLSCRGVDGKGNNMRAHGKMLLQSIPDSVLEKELAQAKKVVHEFDQRCQSVKVYQNPDRMRAMATSLLPMLGREDGIGRLLGFADGEPKVGDVSEEELRTLIESTSMPEDINRMAKQSNYDIFDLEEIVRLPVYVDEELKWNLFQSKDGLINCMMLEEDGALELRKSISMDDIDLLPRSREALEIFKDYAKTIIGRDHFEGYAAHICDQYEYRHDLMIVYLGVLGTQLLDLWWRASLIGKLYEMDEIDAWLAREGIRAFDMDCLGAPTIGSLI